MKRLLWFQPGLDNVKTAGASTTEDRRMVETKAKSNLVSSLTNEGQHMPALDIDLPVSVKPSTTDGHFHLFIDKPMTWEAYVKLLGALADAGIIECGFYTASVNRGATFLRTKRPKEKVNGPGGAYINDQKPGIIPGLFESINGGGKK